MKHTSFVRFVSIAIALLLFVNSFSVAFAVDAISISSPSAIVMDARSGNVIFEKDGYSSYYPASSTKILTAILVIEACENNENNLSFETEVTMSANAIWGFDRNSSHIALDEGEIVTIEDLLHGLLLASANECALALAEVVGGSVDNFMKMMNEKAALLGVNETCNFVNPHGLFDSNHTASAYDLAKIMQYCIQNENFVRISSTTLYSIPSSNKSSQPRVFCNCYKMLSTGAYYHTDVICGKTGWTSQSLGTLVNYAYHSDTETGLIVVTTGASSNANAYDDVASLLDYFFANYHNVELPPVDQPYVDIPQYGQLQVKYNNFGYYNKITKSGDTLKIKKVTANTVLLPISSSEQDITTNIINNQNLTLPINKGVSVGRLQWSLNGQVVAEKTLYSKEAIPISVVEMEKINDSPSIFWQVVGNFLMFGVGGFVLLNVCSILVLRYRYKKRKQRRRQLRRHNI